MAASHDACTHPRTPAGRAWCRKNGGPGVSPDPLPTRKPHDGFGAFLDGLPPAKPARVKKPSTRTNHAEVGKATLADLPRVFKTAVDWATANGCAHDVYTKGKQTMVDLTADHGTLTLTWATTTPEGVHAVSWRPAGTSVTSRLATVNQGLTKLKGEQ
jgi:hypothetical protein